MRIPGYKIQRLIGKGGMSSVYLAVQESLGRRVALKVLKRFDDPKNAERFVHEGRIIASLNHRNIITIHDIGTIGDRHYIAMEHLEGRSLAERIDEGIPIAKVFSLLEQMAACLHFVHRKGIIHRDIKPSNILFHADGTPKLTDFGIAKVVDSDQELTMDGSALGSPYYLSPEQAEGLPLDGRSDIYSLGIVFYQMLTGQKPYARSSPIETIVAHLTQPIPVLPDQYLPYQGLLERMIAKRREDRVGSAKELVYLLREAKDATTDHKGRPNPIGQTTTPMRSWWQGFALARHPQGAGATRVAALLVTASLLLVMSTTLLRNDADADRVEASAVPATFAEHAQFASDDARGGSTTPRMTQAGPVAAETIEAEPPAIENPLTSTGTTVPEPVAATMGPTDAPSEDPLADVHAESPSIAPGSPGLRPEPAAGPGAEPAIDTDAQAIADWLRAAEAALQAYRLTTPAGDNAYDYYRMILAIDPYNADARAGIRAIAQRYEMLARNAIEKDNTRQARVYLQRGLDLSPGDPALAALHDEAAQRDLERAQAQAGEAVAETIAPAPAVPQEQTSVRGREGTGNIVKDFKSVWRAIFN